VKFPTGGMVLFTGCGKAEPASLLHFFAAWTDSV